MGMDVYGTDPSAEVGEYFRNNVWWWHPLADFIIETYPDLASKVEGWHYNDGDGLGASDATELARRIKDDLASGVVADYEARYNAALAALPVNQCEWCAGTGVRTDEVGVRHGMPEAPLDEALSIVFGRTHGDCNGCRGAGSRIAWEANYPFSAENVSEFADFLESCGGFKIC